MVVLRDFRGVVGRLGFSAEVLRHIKAFLAPLYAWASTGPDGAARPIPVAIRLLFRWLVKVVSDSPLVSLRPRIRQAGEVFRADAKAEGTLVVVGGWEVLPG